MPIHHSPPIFKFHDDFNSTWRLTPESLGIINSIINSHPEFPFILKILIRNLGIPDLHIKTENFGNCLNIKYGIGPIQKSQTIHFRTIGWKGLYNTYNLMVQMEPGYSKKFRICGMIPGRGFSQFTYLLLDDGKFLNIDVSVPMTPDSVPFTCSLMFYSIQRNHPLSRHSGLLASD